MASYLTVASIWLVTIFGVVAFFPGLSPYKLIWMFVFTLSTWPYWVIGAIVVIAIFVAVMNGLHKQKS